MPADLVEFGVAEQDVAHDQRHFRDELPLFFALLRGKVLHAERFAVPVFPFLAARFDPFQLFFVFLFIVDAEFYAADDLRHIHPFRADAEVALHRVHVAVAAADAHGDGADVHVRLVAHLPDGERAAREAQDLFLHVGGDAAHVRVLHVPPVNGEGGQPALCVQRHGGGEVHRAGALGAVESPHRFYGERVDVHRFAAVAPAGRNGQRGAHVFARKFIGTARRFRAAADGRIRDDDFCRRAVRVKDVAFNKFFCAFRHVHGLFFQAFAHAEPPSVDDGADPDLRFHICFLLLRAFRTSLSYRGAAPFSMGELAFFSQQNRNIPRVQWIFCAKCGIMRA